VVALVGVNNYRDGREGVMEAVDKEWARYRLGELDPSWDEFYSSLTTKEMVEGRQVLSCKPATRRGLCANGLQ
jgi:hypothetical protein